jgi:copper chaperone CopZ
MQKYKFQLKDLTCEACVKIAKRKIEKIGGVMEVSLNLEGKLDINSDREIVKGDIEQALENTKYKVA